MYFKLIFDLNNGVDKVVYPEKFETLEDTKKKLLQELNRVFLHHCEKLTNHALSSVAVHTDEWTFSKAYCSAMTYGIVVMDVGLQMQMPDGTFYTIEQRD